MRNQEQMLAGKHILVTGVSRPGGIGAAIVKMLAENGAGDGSVCLAWEKIPGTLHYHLYRSSAEEGRRFLIRTGKTSYRDTEAEGGRKYEYSLKYTMDGRRYQDYPETLSVTAPYSRYRNRNSGRLFEKGAESTASNRTSPMHLAKGMMPYDVISFDVFDTLVLRPFSRPSDLFILVGERLDIMDFCEIRIHAEQEARRISELERGNKEVTLLDIYRLVEEETGVEAEKNYAAVLGVGSTNPYGSKTQGVTLMLADGSIVEVQAKMTTGQDWDNLSDNGGSPAENLVSDVYGDIVTYKVDDNGVYELTVAGTGTGTNLTGHGNWADNLKYADGTTNYQIQFVNGRSQFVLDEDDNGADETYFATEDTIFFVGTDLSDLNYQVYVGYENMPSTATDVPASAFAYVTNSEYSKQLDAVYLVVERLAGISAVDTYFVKEQDAKIYTDNTGSYYRLPAMVDGEKTEVKVDATKTIDGINFTANSTVYGLFAITNVTTDSNGIITNFNNVTDTTTFDADVSGLSESISYSGSNVLGTVRANSGVIGIGNGGDKDTAEYYAYGSDTLAYYVDEDYEDISIISVSSIANDTNDLVYAIRDDSATYKKLDTIVIVEQEDSSVVTHTVTITGANSNAWVNKVDGTHYADQNSITVEDGKDFQFKLDPVAGKQVASVKVGSTELTPDATGVYTVSNVTGNITVNVTCGNVLSLSVTNTAASGITVQVGDNAPEAVAGSSATTTGTYNVTNGQVVNVTVVYGNASGTPTLTATNATAIPVNTVAGSVTYQVWIDSNASTSVELQFNIA